MATCVYGITFISTLKWLLFFLPWQIYSKVNADFSIVQEQTAANSVSFASNILDAAHITLTPGKVIAIAIAANTTCCLLHALSRKWGIILNNVFGSVKLLILVFLIICGFVCEYSFPFGTSMKYQIPSTNPPLFQQRYFELSNMVLICDRDQA